MRKPSLGSVGLAVLLFYGIVPMVFGLVILGRELASESLVLIVCGILFLLGGVVMLVSAIWSLGGKRRPLWIGSGASLWSACVMASATLTNVLPCSGPD
jgi:uncharacterized membrane protein HdeD (DUF308 family)